MTMTFILSHVTKRM